MSLRKKIGVGLASLILLLAIGSLIFIWSIGAWGILFPSDSYDSTPPSIADDFGEGRSVRVLVYSKTNSFRHSEGIAASHALIDKIAARRGWAVFHSENSATLETPFLENFDVVVFSSATGNHASDLQDAAFRGWLEKGGGWMGIHAAGDGSHAGWTWYAENLVSGEYLGHILGPQTQEARVVVEDKKHPVTQGLPDEFQHEEEWYSWDRGAREAGFHVLITVDETSYSPWIRGLGQEKDISMKDHPIVWSRCIGRGRALYTAMGHWGDAYQQDYTVTLLENGIEWAAGTERGACSANGAR